MKKILALIKSQKFLTMWMIIVIPLLTLFVDIAFSAAQDSFGITTTILSLTFLTALIAEIVLCYKAFFARFICIHNDPFQELIISDNELSEFERTFSGQEIWVLTYDLDLETDGGLYSDIISNNVLNRGIKYKYFVRKSRTALMRINQLKRKYQHSNNVEYYLLSDDFFFLVPKLDFVIYDPYKSSATGRRAYLGINLPDKDVLYETKVDDLLTDAIASKLLEVISTLDE